MYQKDKLRSDFIETKYRLKYFYFIDVDDVMNRIKSSKEYKCFEQQPKVTDICNLFQLIFLEIIKSSQAYTSYILSPDLLPYYSFFHEFLNQDSFALAGYALFHHCILRGFHICLSPSNMTSELGVAETVPFTSRNYHLIRKGCFPDSNSQKKFGSVMNCNDLNANNLSSNFTSYYNQFNDEYQLTTYSRKILSFLSDYNTKKNMPIPVEVCNPAMFLFLGGSTGKMNKNGYNEKKGSVNPFNNYLIKQQLYLDQPDPNFTYDKISPSKYINQFWKIKKHAFAWRKDLSILDSILFDRFLEPTYGIFLFSYVNHFLMSIEDENEIQHKKSLKCLAGTSLNTIINDYIATLPFTYNRSIFLKYVCQAVLSSDSLESQYPPHTGSIGTRYSSASVPIDSFSATAIQLIGNFFRHLHCIVIPLLEDLWDVLTNESLLGIKITNEYYQEYIKNYYEIITMEYTKITSDFFPKSGPKHYHFFDCYKYISDKLKERKDDLDINPYSPYKMNSDNSDSKEPDYSGKKTITYSVNKELQSMIQNYCKTSNINKSAHEAFIDELTQQYNENIQTDPTVIHSKRASNFSFERKQFLDDYAKIILQFTSRFDMGNSGPNEKN